MDDVWVNDAMTSVFAPFAKIEPEEFHRVTEVTYLGVTSGTKAALRRMPPRDRGAIVQVGSALAGLGWAPGKATWPQPASQAKNRGPMSRAGLMA